MPRQDDDRVARLDVDVARLGGNYHVLIGTRRAVSSTRHALVLAATVLRRDGLPIPKHHALMIEVLTAELEASDAINGALRSSAGRTAELPPEADPSLSISMDLTDRIDTKAAAKLLGNVSTSLVTRWARDGVVDAIKPGREWLFDRTDVNRLVERKRRERKSA